MQRFGISRPSARQNPHLVLVSQDHPSPRRLLQDEPISPHELPSGELVGSLRFRAAHKFHFERRARPRTRESVDSVSAIGQPISLIFNLGVVAGRSIPATCTARDQDPPCETHDQRATTSYGRRLLYQRQCPFQNSSRLSPLHRSQCSPAAA